MNYGIMQRIHTWNVAFLMKKTRAEQNTEANGLDE